MSISNAYKGNEIPVTVSDSSSTKYRFMTGDTTDTTNLVIAVKAATGETTPPIGILQEGSSAADAVRTLRIYGTAKLEVDGSGTAIDINTLLVAKAGGVGVSSTTPDAAQQWVGARSLGVSTASGDIILVKIVDILLVKGTA